MDPEKRSPDKSYAMSEADRYRDAPTRRSVSRSGSYRISPDVPWARRLFRGEERRYGRKGRTSRDRRK